MSPFVQNAYRPEVLKLASLAQAGLETAGLAMLARPSMKTLRDPKADKKEKSHAKAEVAGLGTLALHPAYEAAKANKHTAPMAARAAAGVKRAVKPVGKALGFVKHASVHERIKTAAGNAFGQFAGRAAHLAENAGKVVKQTVPAVGKTVAPEPKKKLTMDMIMAAKKRMAGGGTGHIG
jgi:hypothetical protein